MSSRTRRSTRGCTGAPAGSDSRRVLPDFAAAHAAHKRPGVTLELPHREYREQHPGGYCFTQFCDYYRRWLRRRRLSMRQIHQAGEKLFVAFCAVLAILTSPALL